VPRAFRVMPMTTIRAGTPASTWWRRHGLELLLLAAVLVQTVVLFESVLLPTLDRIRRVYRLPARERSARLAFGDEFAEYIRFLEEVVPSDATVIVPPVAVDEVLGNEGIVQYYLFPRRVSNCPRTQPVEPCVAGLTGPDSYILAVGGFPPPEVVEQAKTLVRFDDDRGVYVPRPGLTGGE
jgi:hypothetical protein